MAALKVVTTWGARHAPDAPAWKGSNISAHMVKGERLREHFVMVRDLPDGSHVILDGMIIVGHDKAAKRPTARAIIQVGRRAESLVHKGDYYVTAENVLRYQPICTLGVKIEANDDINYSSRAYFLAMEKHVWRIFSKSQSVHRGSFWLATIGRRALNRFQPGVIKGMKYLSTKDQWRVPANKRAEVKRRKALEKQNAWAFEKVDAVAGVTV